MGGELVRHRRIRNSPSHHVEGSGGEDRPTSLADRRANVGAV